MDQTGDQLAYSYVPLPGSDFIRVLELKPSIDNESPLQSSLQIARLGHDDYPYDAMSYTWGEPVFSQTLYIEATLPHTDPSNGGFYPIGITSNLSKMLRNMRHPLRTRRLWVDALCINQHDDVEKSNQIPLMFRIYQQASRVVIWLGDNIEDQRRMRLLSIFARRRLRHNGPVSTMSHDYLQAAKEAVYRFTEIPWFSRLWVVQEAVINTDVTMYCGVERMSLVRLFDVVKDMQSLPEHQPARIRSLLEMRNLWNKYARGHASEIPPGRCDGSRPCPTIDIMERFKHFGCADPRDRVYAISTLQKCIRIVPDYRLSPEQVYLNFASSMRDHGQLQWVLQEAAIRENPPGIPSWVPDLRIRPIRQSIFTKHSEINDEYLGDCTNVSVLRKKGGSDAITLKNCYLFESSGDSIRGSYPRGEETWCDLWAPRASREYFTSTRIRFDPCPMIVTWRGDSFPDPPKPAEAKAWMKTTFELVWQQFSKRATTASRRASKALVWTECIATVASTLVADGMNVEDLHPSTSKEAQELSKSISNIFNHGKYTWGAPSLGYSQLFTRCFQEIIEETVDQTTMCDAFIQLVIITMQGRCFFTSDMDEDPEKYRAPIACGIGPSHLQIDDQALLHYMPFWEQAYLLRAYGRTEKQSISCFELVGDCYLKEPLGMPRERLGVMEEMMGLSLDLKKEEEQRTIILK